jgi:rod shape-determining protein MreC
VIAFGPGEGFDWTVTIDAGSGSGVRAGQSVTDGVGLVGRVLHADPNSSVVLLAPDPGSGVGARDTRTGEIGVATGEGADGLVFTPLDPHAVVKAGDELVTGPTPASSYVAGIVVGRISAVRTTAGGVLRASVQPAASPTAVDLVGVIVDGAVSKEAAK